jgi:oxygen-independent coproporphyrinogen-3 oxidase
MQLRYQTGFLQENIETIYFGGGTPSLLSEKELNSLLETIHHLWPISRHAEITLEANPEDVDLIQCAAWKQAGINRISLGVQSLFDEELNWMNRAHSAEASKKSVLLLKETGFDQFSVDLIFGGPFMTIDRWEQTLLWIEDQQLTHISCYGLTVEPKTPLANSIKNKSTPAPDADKMATQFEMLMSFAEDNEWEHYEISNLAKKGKRSKHNSSYWRGVPYLGIGPSAHSFDGKSRRWNIADNKKYVEQINTGFIPEEMEVLTPIQQLNETIMIRLRCMEGCSLTEIEKRFGKDKANTLLKQSEQFVSAGHMVNDNGSLRLTREGKLFADRIASELFFIEGE